MDAKNIKHLLLNNSTLELLDLHCNELNDDSLQHICEGLAEQPGRELKSLGCSEGPSVTALLAYFDQKHLRSPST